MLVFDNLGWLMPNKDHRVTVLHMAARADLQGRQFTPGGKTLAQHVMKRYGGPALVVVHGTDIVPKSVMQMALRKAKSSPRRAGYHFLLGEGLVIQLESILRQTWHCGSSNGLVLDGWDVRNPNAWGPGIEMVNWQKLEMHPDGVRARKRRKVQGAMKTQAILDLGEYTTVQENNQRVPWHNYDPTDVSNLVDLLHALYDGPGAIWSDRVYRHSAMAPGRRIDPGPLLDVEELAEMAEHDPEALKDLDESNEGEPEEPWNGPGEHD